MFTLISNALPLGQGLFVLRNSMDGSGHDANVPFQNTKVSDRRAEDLENSHAASHLICDRAGNLHTRSLDFRQ